MFSPSLPAAEELPAAGGPKRTRGDVHPAITFHLADDAALAFIGGASVVFSGRGQKIYALNESAAYLACKLERGASYSELLADLVRNGTDPESAATALGGWLVAWSRAGIAGAEIARTPGRAWRRCSLCVGPASFGLLHQDPALLDAILPAFRHLVGGGGAGTIDYYLSAADGLVFIARERGVAAIVRPEQAAPTLKAMLVEDVLGAARDSIALHTACLIERDAALLLGGSPGAGKSTLTLALLAAGFGYGADDVTLLDARGRARGVPFAPTVKIGATRFFPGLEKLPVHRRLDGRRLRYWPMEPLPRRGWMPVRWLVRLRRRSGIAAELVPSEPMDALAGIMGEALTRSGQASVGDFHALKYLVAGAECHELHYSDLGDAVRLLTRLCRND